MRYGPLEAIRREGRPPVLDIGAVQLIRQGHITVRGDIDHIEKAVVHFKAGHSQSVDAIVAAIGYYREDDKILNVNPARFDDLRHPATRQQFFGADGLYFCGFWISPTGQFRSIAKDALLIAKHLAQQNK
jgi:hypothetical protein